MLVFSLQPEEDPTAKTSPLTWLLFLSIICDQLFFHFPDFIPLPH